MPTSAPPTTPRSPFQPSTASIFRSFFAPRHSCKLLALTSCAIQGRKLRTEFKKVLKEGEKERIERDKALKRMRSQQQLTVETVGPPVGSWNRREASAPGGYGGGGAHGDDDDFGRVVQGQFSTAFAGRAYVPAPPVPTDNSGGGGYSSSPPSDVGTSVSSRMVNSNSDSDLGSSRGPFSPPVAASVLG